MKHLTTLFALLLSCTMLAQGPVEFPWNPDSDGDDFIGVNDLMALLGEYGSEFSEEGLYLVEDSASAAYYVGKMPYILCAQSCSNLPGSWKVPSSKEIFSVYDGLADTRTGSQTTSWHWIETDFELGNYTNGPNTKATALCNAQTSNSSPQYVLTLYAENISSDRGCTCFTREIPRVEYTYCGGGSPSNESFNQCINEKLAAGWHPLSGFPVARDRQGYLGGSDSWNTHYGAQSHASFWRWAE